MALKNCRECGKQISTEAGACPNCGAPNKSASSAKKKTSPVTMLIALLLFGGLIISMFSDMSADGPAATATPAAATIDKSPGAQQKRKKLIEQLQQQGFFGDISCRSSGATAIIEPGFYALDFKDKEKLLRVAYAFCFDGSQKFVSVQMKDSKTNKMVGNFSAEVGLKL